MLSKQTRQVFRDLKKKVPQKGRKYYLHGHETLANRVHKHVYHQRQCQGINNQHTIFH